jgi:16S rRNA G966 N2-methylase RsmD
MEPEEPKPKARPNMFLIKHKENEDLNQYWYSKKTIADLADQVDRNATKCAFLSTPSIYFNLQNKEVKSNSKNFDIDENFGKKDKNFVYYDFNKPEDIPEELHHQFDFILIDPPFITEEVWQKVTFSLLTFSTLKQLNYS